MNQQEIIDKVTKRLRDGRGRAMSNGRCTYLASNGNKCAVGCLLPHELSTTLSNNNLSLRMLVNEYDVPDFIRDNIAFLEDLQKLHDHSDSWDGRSFIGEHALEQFCEQHELTYTPPQSQTQ